MAVVSSMNGDIPNFPMGPKDEDSFVAGNLHEEVFIVPFPFSVIDLTSLCAFQTEDRMRQLKLRFGECSLCLQEAKIMSEFH